MYHSVTKLPTNGGSTGDDDATQVVTSPRHTTISYATRKKLDLIQDKCIRHMLTTC